MLRTANGKSFLPRMLMKCLCSRTVASLAGSREPPAATSSTSPRSPSLLISTDSTPSSGSQGRSTTAPAPSPKSTQVLRSVKSTMRVSVSTPITSTVSAKPLPITERPIPSPYTKPVQAAKTSYAAARRAPSFCCTVQAQDGR